MRKSVDSGAGPFVIALYIRLSIEDAAVESLSIENQQIKLHGFVESFPDAAGAKVLEFIDNGFSGTNFERPAIQQLLEQVQANQIGCIIVKDFSRFGRDSLETAYWTQQVFPLFRVRFISVDDGFDSAQHKGDTGGMEVAFQFLINEQYSRDLSMKSKTSKYALMKQGKYQSKLCPYGYYKGENGRLEIDEDTAPVVRLIFDLALAGKSSAQIAGELYARGFPTPGELKAQKGNTGYDVSRTHHVWVRSTILRILADERYTGTYIIGKREVLEVGGSKTRLKDKSRWFCIPDHHPSIVGKDVFEQVQQAAKRFRVPNRKSHDYPLRGKLVCGCCDHSLHRRSNKKVTYYCEHFQYDVEAPCHGLSVSEQEMEDALFEIIKAKAQVILGTEFTGALPGDGRIQLSQRDEYIRQIRDLEDEKCLLYERFMLGDITELEYRAMSNDCNSELFQAKQAHGALQSLAEKTQKENAHQSRAQEAAKQADKETGFSKSLADLLIDRVLVFPGNRLEIVWKIHDFSV